jgi:hypothetical protein
MKSGGRSEGGGVSRRGFVVVRRKGVEFGGGRRSH